MLCCHWYYIIKAYEKKAQHQDDVRRLFIRYVQNPFKMCVFLLKHFKMVNNKKIPVAIITSSRTSDKLVKPLIVFSGHGFRINTYSK